jgi:hypothetical protein
VKAMASEKVRPVRERRLISHFRSVRILNRLAVR